MLDARTCNTRDGITGALICRHDVFLQLLEGPADKVQAACARIGRDDRHVGMKILVSTPITTRTFADWAMLHDPEQSWIWTEDEIAGGILDRATPKDVQAMFETLAQKARDGSLT